MDIQSVFTNSSGKTIHSIVCGQGKKPLHFLHANGFCAGVYLPFYTYFEKEFRIVATDIPGHGDSDHHGMARILHWDIFVDDVKQAMEKNMETPVVGVGHSLGAVITLLAAAKHPGLFSHIILIDPVIFSKPMIFLLYLAKKAGLMKHNPLASGARRRKTRFKNHDEALRRFSSGRGMFKTWRDEFVQSYCDHGLKWEADGSGQLKCDPETEAQIYESVLLDIWNYPGRITCPVLLIRGERSTTFTPSAASILRKKIPGASLETVPGASHFIPMEKPVECMKLIENFLKNKA